MKRFVITGTGRCGTTYISVVFSRLGFACGHEAFLNRWGNDYDTCPKWDEHFEGESAAAATPFLGRIKAVKFLQKRNKQDTVRSLMKWGMFKNMDTPYDRFVQHHIGKLEGDWQSRCSQYYDRWNALAEPNIDMQYHIEDLDATLLHEMTGLIGRQKPLSLCKKVLNEVPTTINSVR